MHALRRFPPRVRCRFAPVAHPVAVVRRPTRVAQRATAVALIALPRANVRAAPSRVVFKRALAVSEAVAPLADVARKRGAAGHELAVPVPRAARNAAPVLGSVGKAEDALALCKVVFKGALEDRAVRETDDAAPVALPASNFARVGRAGRKGDIRSGLRQGRAHRQRRDGVEAQR